MEPNVKRTTGLPLLRRHAKISHGDDHIVIQYLMEEVTLHGPTAHLFGEMLPHLDGKTALDQVASRIGERPERVGGLVEQLRRAGVLGWMSPEPPGPGDQGDQEEGAGLMTGEDFYHLHRRYGSAWLREVYEHPLWDKIVTGRASRAQVLGFAFEKYHYIEGAHEHMAIAAANATPEMMPHLARHFIEEYAHGDIYRKGLRSLFPDDIILASQPLPSTRALINYLSESAARDSFAYYAGNELLQMTENTSGEAESQSIDSFYQAMLHHYPYTGPIIESFIAHTRADQKLGHESVFWQMCQSIPPLTRQKARDAINVVRSMAEHLILFMDGIDVFYARFPAMPRVPCSLLSE